MSPQGAVRPRDTVIALLCVLLASSAVIAPWLRPGYLLSYDMVFVPQQPITADVLGLGSQTARAVPSDLIVAALSHVVSAAVVQRLVLGLILLAAGTGAALLSKGGASSRAAGGIAYLWTPYLAEHLQLGQWAVLIGFASLPWVVLACRAVRAKRSGAWPQLLFTLGVCSIGGASSWLLALIMVVPALTVPGMGRGIAERIRSVVVALGALLAYALPWLLPTVLRPSGIPADRQAAAVFAARSDSILGAVGSVLTGGGGWNAQVDPPGRGSVLAGLGALVLLALGVAGIWLSRRDTRLAPLAISGGLGLLVALASLSPARSLLADVPGGGLVRDGQRYIAPWLLCVAYGLSATVHAVRIRRAVAAGPVLAWLLVVLPVAVLPGMAWGISGRMAPVRYPADYLATRALIDSDPRPGAVLVLPFQTYRAFAWNGGRTSLDPIPRMLDRTVISSSSLPVAVSGSVQVVAGDDPLARHLDDLLATSTGDRSLATRLGQAGIRWVVMDAAAPVPEGLLARYRGAAVSVYEVPAVNQSAAEMPANGYVPPKIPVLGGLVLALILAAGSAVILSYWRVRMLLESREERDPVPHAED